MAKISFFRVLSVIVVMFFLIQSVHAVGPSGYTPGPRDVIIDNVTFKVPYGFIEDDNQSENGIVDGIFNFSVTKHQKTFHQNDLLLLSISVCEFDESVSLDDLNDGNWTNKSINGKEGLFKVENVSQDLGFFNKIHEQYSFEYIENGKLIFIKADKAQVINAILS